MQSYRVATRRTNHRMAAGARHRRRSLSGPLHCLLESRTLLSAFYDLTTLATTADGVFTSFGDLPSINNQGIAAFVGNTNSGSSIWTANQVAKLTNVTASFTAADTGRSFGRGASINDSGQIIARDQLGTDFYVRRWNADQPNQFTDLFQHPATVPGSADNQFASAQTFTAIDNEGDAAFVLYDSVGGTRDLVEESGSNIGDGTYTSLAEYDATGSNASPRPQMTSSGQVLFVSPAGQLVLASAEGGINQIIAGPSTGYVSIGSNAGISQDGRVIVFTAEHGYGPSLWAALQLGRRGKSSRWPEGAPMSTASRVLIPTATSSLTVRGRRIGA